MRCALGGTLGLVALLLAGPARAQQAPRLDVAFLLDATGSMGDEIDAVKERIQEMIAQIAAGDPAPDVRFGIVAYRDRGDEYVTRVYPLTRDIDQVVADLATIEANGGGDYPESLVEALHTVVHRMDWETGGDVGRLVFLIADAPPHLDYADDYDYREEVQMAAELGVTVHAMGASGLDEDGERLFRELAAATGGQFKWLAYESRYVDEDGVEVIVVVEGRTATYTKGDSTWTAAGDGVGFVPGGGRGGGVDEAKYDAAVPTADVSGGSPMSTSTNLADLITDAVRDAAAARGVEYDGSTNVERASWGTVKRSR